MWSQCSFFNYLKALDVLFEKINEKWVAVVKSWQNQGVNKNFGRIIVQIASAADAV
jgi:uncharacterized Fe-S cluster-containing radical SAM superfamily protein